MQSSILIYDVIMFLSSVSADGIWRSTEDLPSQISFTFLGSVNQTRSSLTHLRQCIVDQRIVEALFPGPYLDFHPLK